ncbi:hypothetical protein ACWNXI_02590 [Caldibacillus thermoamylovorans]
MLMCENDWTATHQLLGKYDRLFCWRSGDRPNGLHQLLGDNSSFLRRHVGTVMMSVVPFTARGRAL